MRILFPKIRMIRTAGIQAALTNSSRLPQNKDKMKTSHKIWSGALALAVIASECSAAGFQLNEQSISGLGRSYAGEGIIGDDLSAAWYNPAGMTLLPGTQMQVGGVGVEMNLSYKGDSGQTENGRKRTAPIVHQMITHQFTDRLWGGFAVAMPYGLSTSFNDDWEGATRGHGARLLVATFNPSLAYKVNDHFSVGAGWQAQHIDASITMKKSVSGLGVHNKLEATDWGYGWNAGFMWSPSENLRFGFGYRSQMNHKARGHVKMTPDDATKAQVSQLQAAAALGNHQAQAALAMIKGTVDAMGIDSSSLMANGSVALAGGGNLKSPANANLTVTWKYSPKLRLSGTIRWTDWSSLGKIRINAYTANGELPHDATDVRMNWRDTWFASVGYDLDITPQWTIRGGVAFDRSPIKHAIDRNALVPDTNRIWATLGATWRPMKSLQFDVAATHLHGIGSTHFYDHNGKKLGEFDKLDCWMYGLGIVYRF